MYVTYILFFVKTRSICNAYRLIHVVVVVVVVVVVALQPQSSEYLFRRRRTFLILLLTHCFLYLSSLPISLSLSSSLPSRPPLSLSLSSSLHLSPPLLSLSQLQEIFESVNGHQTVEQYSNGRTITL